jgi:hypothetical protein
MSKKKQLSASVEPDLYDEVDEMAKKEERSLSEMTAILIKNAVKERKRKRKNAKEE